MNEWRNSAHLSEYNKAAKFGGKGAEFVAFAQVKKLQKHTEMQTATLRVCVASTNPVKVGAVKGAMETCFTDAKIEVTGVNVASGVSDQPMTDSETRLVQNFNFALRIRIADVPMSS